MRRRTLVHVKAEQEPPVEKGGSGIQSALEVRPCTCLVSKQMQRGADHPFASDRGCFAVTVYRDERFPIASGHGAIPIEPPESLQWIIGVTKGLGDLYHAWPSHLSFRSGSSAQQTGDAQH